MKVAGAVAGAQPVQRVKLAIRRHGEGRRPPRAAGLCDPEGGLAIVLVRHAKVDRDQLAIVQLVDLDVANALTGQADQPEFDGGISQVPGLLLVAKGEPDGRVHEQGVHVCDMTCQLKVGCCCLDILTPASRKTGDAVGF